MKDTIWDFLLRNAKPGELAIREIEETGGLELADFIGEIEKELGLVVVATPVKILPNSGF